MAKARLELLKESLERKYAEKLFEAEHSDECDVYDIIDYSVQVMNEFVFCAVYRLTINLVDVYNASGRIVYQYDDSEESMEEVYEKLKQEYNTPPTCMEWLLYAIETGDFSFMEGMPTQERRDFAAWVKSILPDIQSKMEEFESKM